MKGAWLTDMVDEIDEVLEYSICTFPPSFVPKNILSSCFSLRGAYSRDFRSILHSIFHSCDMLPSMGDMFMLHAHQTKQQSFRESFTSAIERSKVILQPEIVLNKATYAGQRRVVARGLPQTPHQHKCATLKPTELQELVALRHQAKEHDRHISDLIRSHGSDLANAQKSSFLAGGNAVLCHWKKSVDMTTAKEFFCLDMNVKTYTCVRQMMAYEPGLSKDGRLTKKRIQEMGGK